MIRLNRLFMESFYDLAIAATKECICGRRSEMSSQWDLECEISEYPEIASEMSECRNICSNTFRKSGSGE